MKREKNPFSIFFDQKLNALNDREGWDLTKRDIGVALGIGDEMFRKIVNKNKPDQDRDCIIAIAAMLHLNSDEANEAIHTYDPTMPQLKAADTNIATRDDLLIDILENQAEEQKSIQEIDSLLSSSGFPVLHIIDHRAKSPEDTDALFMCVDDNNGDYYLQYNLEEYIYGDMYQSLETEFVYKTNRFSTRMKIVCTTDNSEYWLSCIYEIRYDKRKSKVKCEYKYMYVKDKDAPVQVANVTNVPHLKLFFLKMKYHIKSEKCRLLNVLDDTRNYHERISAKVINNELHVFYETYNYSVPELGEYYLMDYVNGKYTLYVSHQSRFMRFYLSAEDYHDLFGEISDKLEETYESIEQIERAIEGSKTDRKGIIKLRMRAFCKAQEKINTLIDNLRLGQAHIRNLEMIFDNPYDVLSYYKVTDTYKCSYDTEFGEINGVDIYVASFNLSDGSQFELSVDDLLAGFKLGLSTIEEIGVFLLEHKTLEIAALLQVGLVSPKND